MASKYLLILNTLKIMDDQSKIKVKGGGILPLVIYVIVITIVLVVIKAFIG